MRRRRMLQEYQAGVVSAGLTLSSRRRVKQAITMIMQAMDGSNCCVALL